MRQSLDLLGRGALLLAIVASAAACGRSHLLDANAGLGGDGGGGSGKGGDGGGSSGKGGDGAGAPGGGGRGGDGGFGTGGGGGRPPAGGFGGGGFSGGGSGGFGGGIEPRQCKNQLARTNTSPFDSTCIDCACEMDPDATAGCSEDCFALIRCVFYQCDGSGQDAGCILSVCRQWLGAVGEAQAFTSQMGPLSACAFECQVPETGFDAGAQ